MEITLSNFESHIGEEFTARVEGADRTSRLVLREVIACPPRVTKLPVRKDPFRMYFHGPVETDISRRIAWLSHAGGEEMILIYLEPMSVLDGIIEYEVIIG